MGDVYDRADPPPYPLDTICPNCGKRFGLHLRTTEGTTVEAPVDPLADPAEFGLAVGVELFRCPTAYFRPPVPST